ncbi:MAG: GGDEF domain-containing protein [Butyrivibrio sp.]|nr:GGDEF domain-containing protein [Butyrivibrio sp.]
MQLRRFSKLIIFITALILVIFIIYVIRDTADEVQISSATIHSIDDGWTLKCEGQTTENVTITTADIGIINDKDVVEITRVLKDVGLSNPCLSFFSKHAVTDVYLDGELIYTFGQYYVEKNRTVPDKRHHIPLGDDYAGKTLRIVYTGSRRSSFTSLDSIYLGKRSDILTKEIGQSWVSILIGFFLFTLGIVLIILSPYLFIYHNNDLRIFFSGLISIMLAVYIMAFNGVFDILINNAALNTTLEYVSLYNIPTTILGYLMSSYTGKERKIFHVMFIFNSILFISALVLFSLHIARISDFTIFLHMACAVEGVGAIIIIIRTYLINRKDMSTHAYSSDNLFVSGLSVFMALSIVDIIRYNLQKYTTGRGQQRASLLGFTLGALVFVTCLLLSYFFYTIFSSNMASMQSRIMSMAYTDTLTGLSNRARCEQMLNILSEDHSTYVIISLDLNYLKKVNDTLGHHEGDRLLTGFSTILTDCFWDATLIGRMGGDEFMVVMMDERTFNVTKRIHEFYSMIGEWNNKELSFKYSAAYGYAYSHEVPNGSAKEVYMLADNRMYEMKREQHQTGGQEVIVHA